MELVADIEANGLYSEVTQIHCVVTIDKATKEVKKFYEGSPDGDIKSAVDYLNKADMVIGHNWIQYDARVLKKFYPEYIIDVKRIRDTYIRSLLFDPHREKHPRCPVSKTTVDGRRQIGPHSLENWGYVVGRGKVEHEDWTKFTKEMLHRCVEDVYITDLVDDCLIKDEGKWDWSTAEYIEKEFALLMAEQESYGWLFDEQAARDLIKDLTKQVDKIDKEVIPNIPPVVQQGNELKNIRKKDGGYYKTFISWLDQCADSLGDYFYPASFAGPFTRVSFEPINLASDKQVKEYLLSIGWVPTEWNYKKDGKRIVKDPDTKEPIKTSPKLTEDSFESLESDIGKTIARRITLCHRRSQIQGWIDSLRQDGRIEAGGNSVGTNTGRVTHRTVVNVPKAEENVFLGKEMRSLFTVPEGYTLLGADLSSLEDRVAGHHTFPYDGGAYARLLLESDPHQKTADIFGVSRFKGKTSNHALKYGARPGKLSSILECDIQEAAELWQRWWDNHPSLLQLREAIEKALERRGFLIKGRLKKGAFIKGIDGRKIFLRSAHSALNARIQNAGSIVHKLNCIYIKQGIEENWLRANIVGNFHDEIQIEVHEEDTEELKVVVSDAVKKVNKFFDFKIPMESEAKLGKNWKETH